MATARLIPSSIYKTVTNSSLSIDNISNAYANTDSTTYATCTGLSSSTSSVFVYIRGFNFSDVPSDATVTSFSIKVKASESGGKTSTIYACNGTSTVSAVGTATGLSASANVHTFTGGTISWDTLKSYGSNFSIRLDCGRNKKNTTSHVYIYGAEIEVTYSTASEPPTITVGTPSRSIISDETGYDQCVCTFTSDMALQAWEARATKAGTTPARGVGLLVESGTTLAAGATGTVYVENEELTNGDGEYTITVYGQSTQGVWSE